MVVKQPSLPPGARPKPPLHTSLLRGRNGVTNIEDQVRLNYYTPAPTHYRPKALADINEPKPLGKISEARIPSGHQYAAKIHGYVPGPGAYHTPDLKDFPLPEGGRVNRNPPPERFKLDEYPTPPPGAYGVPNDPTVPRVINGKFSKELKVPKSLQDEEKRTRNIPAPGTHEVVEMNIGVYVKGAPRPAKPFCSEGGVRLNVSKPPSYFEVAPKRWKDNPAPDRYDMPSSVNPNKAVGQLTFKYESATIHETKALVNKAVPDAPGPGHYTVPDPPMLGGGCAIKTKGLGHGMPYPFNYNCAPDLGRKFDNLAPVRQANSGDQIYGTGLRRAPVPRFSGAANKGSRPSSAGSEKKVHYTSLEQAGSTAMETNPEDMVKWRSGGFAVLKKSRSEPTVAKAALHPAVEDTKKFYPSLCAGKRGPKDFMPNCVRRPLDKEGSKQEVDAEIARLERGKVNLAVLTRDLESSCSAVLEPLNLDRLRQGAMECLMDKAKDRMIREGVNKEQQEIVLGEMIGVLEEKREKADADLGGGHGDQDLGFSNAPGRD